MASAEPSSLTAMEELLGSTLLTKVNDKPKKTNTLLKNKDLIALYFSANWCPPCQSFTPLLVEFYKSITSINKTIEIVFVSSDRSVQEFDIYYKKMPWLAIPPTMGTAAIKNKLSQTLQIRGIPTLVLLDCKTGNFISNTLRDDVIKVHGKSDEELKKLIQSYKDFESIPLSQASKELQSAGGGQSGIFAFLMFFAKNPMWIFGILYGIRAIMREYRKWTGEDDSTIEEGEIIVDKENEEEF